METETARENKGGQSTRCRYRFRSTVRKKTVGDKQENERQIKKNPHMNFI